MATPAIPRKNTLCRVLDYVCFDMAVVYGSKLTGEIQENERERVAGSSLEMTNIYYLVAGLTRH